VVVTELLDTPARRMTEPSLGLKLLRP
jgi:hypothetical protein